MHESPTPVPGTAAEVRADARARALRTLAQAAAVTVVTGAVTGAYQLISSGDTLDLATVGTAALVGAGTAFCAWAQRKLEGVRRRGGES
jgi:hypothetical protein